jgi:hypothetical protein
MIFVQNMLSMLAQSKGLENLRLDSGINVFLVYPGELLSARSASRQLTAE